MNLRLLLVEPDPEEARFLNEVLAEIEQERKVSGDLRQPWVQMQTMHAATWDEAEAILTTESIDAVLLYPDLPDCQGFETFRRSKIAAPAVPVVLLLEPGEEALGVRMVREGAQDFLIRSRVDCEPLVHALRNAVERERLVTAEHSVRFLDPLTGLANLGCFEMLAERDRKLAERLGTRWMILLAELQDLGNQVELHGEQHRDWALVQFAELLRTVTNPTDTVYRLSPTRFAVTIFETEAEFLEQARVRIERALTKERVATGTATFHPEKPESLEDLLNEAADVLDARETKTGRAEASRSLRRSAGAA